MSETCLYRLVDVLFGWREKFGDMRVRDVRLWMVDDATPKCVTVAFYGPDSQVTELFEILEAKFPREREVTP